jgi:hypothetical protein
MKHRYTEMLVRRLRFEKRFLLRLPALILQFSLVVALMIAVYDEYSIGSAGRSFKQLEALLPNNNVIDLLHSSRSRLVISTTSSLELWHKTVPDSLYSIVDLPYIQYVAMPIEVPCSTKDSALLSIYSSVPNNWTCTDLAHYQSGEASVVFDDYKLGLIPVTILGNSTSDIPESFSLLVIMQLFYDLKNDIMSVVEFRYEHDLLPRSATTVRSSRSNILRDSETSYYLASLVLSCVVCFIDLNLLRGVAPDQPSPNWPFRESFFLHRICPVILSLPTLLMTSYKYYLASDSHLYWLPRVDWKVVLTDSVDVELYSSINKAVRFEEYIHTGSMITLWLALARLILALDVHPRLAMLTETLKRAWDPLVHFLCMFLVLLGAFAVVHHIVIDPSISIARTILMLSGFIMGNPGFSNATILSTLFAVCFGIWMCITALFLLLALILLGFQLYRHDIESVKPFVKPFWSDLVMITRSSVVGMRHRWPAVHGIFNDSESSQTGKPGKNGLIHMICWYERHHPDLFDSPPNPMKSALEALKQSQAAGTMERLYHASRSELRSLHNSIKSIDQTITHVN